MKITTHLYRIFQVLFCLFFFTIIVGIFLQNGSVIMNYKPWLIFLSTIGLGILWFLMIQGFKKIKTIHRWQEIITVTILMIIIILLQILFGIYLTGLPNLWDFGVVHNTATNVALHGIEYTDLGYFYTFPNNFFLLYVLSSIYRLFSFFGITNFAFVGIGVNIISISLSILATYFVIRKLFGVKPDLISLILCLFISPFFNYVPIFYTDTLALLFPILTYLLYLYLDHEKSMFSKKNLLLTFLIAVTVFLGMKMKMTCIIIYVAVLIDFFCVQKKREFFKFLLISIIGIVMVMGIYQMIATALFHYDQEKVDKQSIPYTHWVMMSTAYIEKTVYGNGTYGGYSADDYAITNGISNKDDKIKKNLEVIKERLIDRKVVGNINFYYHKLLYTWNDGMYYAPIKFSSENQTKNFFSNTFIMDAPNYSVYAYISEGVHVLMLILAFLSSSLCFKLPKDKKLIVPYLALFGLTCFLMIWETRSRYLVNFIPLFIVSCMPMIVYYLNLKKGEKVNFDIIMEKC